MKTLVEEDGFWFYWIITLYFVYNHGTTARRRSQFVLMSKFISSLWRRDSTERITAWHRVRLSIIGLPLRQWISLDYILVGNRLFYMLSAGPNRSPPPPPNPVQNQAKSDQVSILLFNARTLQWGYSCCVWVDHQLTWLEQSIQKTSNKQTMAQ